MPNYRRLLNYSVTAPWYKKWYKKYIPFFTRNNRVVPHSDDVNYNRYGTNISKRPMSPQTPVPRLEQTPYGIQTDREMKGINKNRGNQGNAGRILNENFHQQFIRESISTFITSCAVNLNSPPDLSFLDDYKVRLRNPECSEIEAIYLYDRLISVFLIPSISIFVTLFAAREDFGKLITNPGLRNTLDKAQEFLKPYTDKFNFSPEVYKSLFAITVILFVSTITIISVSTAGAVLLPPAAIIAVSSLVGVALPVPATIGLKLSDYEHETYGNFIKRCLKFSEACFKVMFSKDNAIKVGDLNGKLKFWGIPTEAVDYMIKTGTKYSSNPDNSNPRFYIDFLSNLPTHMFNPTNPNDISNIPFTEEIVNYRYTMYDYVKPGQNFTRANTRRRGRAVVETTSETLREGGSRKRRRKQRRTRK